MVSLLRYTPPDNYYQDLSSSTPGCLMGIVLAANSLVNPTDCRTAWLFRFPDGSPWNSLPCWFPPPSERICSRHIRGASLPAPNRWYWAYHPCSSAEGERRGLLSRKYSFSKEPLWFLFMYVYPWFRATYVGSFMGRLNTVEYFVVKRS